MRARCRESTQPHQGGRHRKAGQFGQFAQKLGRFRSRIDNPAPGIKDRPFGAQHKIDSRLDGIQIAIHLRPVALVAQLFNVRRVVVAQRKLDILGDIDHHRTGPARRRDQESLVQDTRQILDPFDEIIVLGAAAGDPDSVAFLEPVGADQIGGHLRGDADQRDRIHQRIGQPGHRIGRPRPRRDKDHAAFPGRSGIAFGHVGRALLVPDENVLDLVLLEHGVVDRQGRAAGIAENMFHPVVGQRPYNHFRAGHLFGHLSHSLL